MNVYKLTIGAGVQFQFTYSTVVCKNFSDAAKKAEKLAKQYDKSVIRVELIDSLGESL